MHLRCLTPVTVAILLTAPVAASADFSHVVASGEPLSSVAATDGLTAEQLPAANGVSPQASPLAGSTLSIPPQATGEGQAEGGEGMSGSEASNTSASAVAGDGDGDADDGGLGEDSSAGEAASTAGEAASNAGEAASATAAGTSSYVVQPGDTLSAIA